MLTLILLLFTLYATEGQNGYWQQHVNYTIRVTLDPNDHMMHGTQQLVYTNNSPDTLHDVYYHLYYNAFQPGSSMDIRSLTIADPDSRVRDRISKLQSDEIGEYFIKSIRQDGKMVKRFIVNETIMAVTLHKPLLPGKKITLDMDYECQIPVQIRRTGRYNRENIAYSMAQWYPRLVAYDINGWATNPYIGREFYGNFGEFDVYLTVPDSFKVAATGNLISSISTQVMMRNQQGNTKFSHHQYTTYRYKAENVHDFVWAADPDYTIEEYPVSTDLKLYFVYQKNAKTQENWKTLQPIMAEAIKYASERFGPYPYSHYTFIQGGDGGMEYPMATLIMGEQSLTGLISVSIHELMHSWYQGVLGIDESLYHWMDEGFTSYAEELVKNHLRKLKMYPGEHSDNPFLPDARRLISFTASGMAEIPALHADHFKTNSAYGVASYVKGALFLSQLAYVVGEEQLQKILWQFYDLWKFKHPTPDNFMQVAEKVSGMELDWYHRYMIHTNDLPDYAIDTVFGAGSKTGVILGRRGDMPMPVDVVVETKAGVTHNYTIPLDLMRAAKKSDSKEKEFLSLPQWHWVKRFYDFTLDIPYKDIKSIQIDPMQRMLDTNISNNKWENKYD